MTRQLTKRWVFIVLSMLLLAFRRARRAGHLDQNGQYLLDSRKRRVFHCVITPSPRYDTYIVCAALHQVDEINRQRTSILLDHHIDIGGVDPRGWWIGKGIEEESDLAFKAVDRVRISIDG